ncbi:hypothetical protein CYMTET_2961 [Cymbomonas tetramitiformis]|uniref:Uncharacterized protein n=1 Tax=Cymbomonas tetramitiformis TaxID=36881 RepID=A0AAE0H476_9CHLO|nr:hypothetical protein CYMTET_2961 [Cymbomonas tetramitiformis]
MGGGAGELASPPASAPQPGEDPAMKAKAILSDFRLAEERNAEIEAKVHAARDRKQDRGRKSAEVSVTPITLVSTSPTKDRWKTSWSYSDPLQVSGSYTQHELMVKEAKEAERQDFLMYLEQEKKAFADRQTKEMEEEARKRSLSAQRRAGEEQVIEAVSNQRKNEAQQLEQKQRTRMARSARKLDQVSLEKHAKQAAFMRKEEEKTQNALSKFDHMNDQYTQKVNNEHSQFDIKRDAAPFKQKQMESRQSYVQTKKEKEAAFKAKWTQMEEENERQRREFLQKKLAKVDNNVNKSQHMTEAVKQELANKTKNRVEDHTIRLSQKEQQWQSNTMRWNQKELDKVKRQEERKKKEDEHSSKMIEKGKEVLKHRYIVEELSISAQVTNKLGMTL